MWDCALTWRKLIEAVTPSGYGGPLERDPAVELWMKPAPNHFMIFDSERPPYYPVVVVETNI